MLLPRRISARSCSALLLLLAALCLPTGTSAQPMMAGSQESAAERHDLSLPLRAVRRRAAATTPAEGRRVRPVRRRPGPLVSGGKAGDMMSGVAGPRIATTAAVSFDGIGQGVAGFTVDSMPPDTNGAAGTTQYVQLVNTAVAVFDKSTHALIFGPVPTQSLWSGFGGGCESDNDGDGIVVYDKAAHRFVITQFAVASSPYLECVAVSTGDDATGSYYRYAFSYGTVFPDYPKLGVWPDAYYVSFNMFSGNTFTGTRVCAYDRMNMLSGAAATQQCFQLADTIFGLLPADLDGSTAPPTSAPGLFVNLETASLSLWRFHVDWSNAANTTFTGPVSLPVAAFVPACNAGICVPQLGTSQKVDSLADRLMNRLAYRNFGDHESLVVTHSVKHGGGGSGLRWYELRDPFGTPTVFQQSTFAPDATFRWMGSIAQDHHGNMAIGYSASSANIHPAIRYSGRLATDAPNTLQAEGSIVEGDGSQTPYLSDPQASERWGDYSAMTIDPVDDCTFWYTTEYLKVNGHFNWSTRIASFRFPSCNLGPAPTATPTPSPTASPTPTVRPTGGTIALERHSLNIGVVNSGGTLTQMTPPQTVAITLPGLGWTATCDQPFVTVTPAGSGSGLLTIQVGASAGIPAVGHAPLATITITAPGASNSPQTITVDVRAYAPGTTAGPTGYFDTPTDGSAGVTGAIPLTGWAVDDIGVARVQLYRAPVAGDPPPGPNGQIYIGDATIVSGARPDVEALFASSPLNYRAAWGYMLLTNLLPIVSTGAPAGGIGTFTLYAYVTDVEGQLISLGSRTFTADNSLANKPFGTIDTPSQGQTVSGTVNNFGWVLTPHPAMISPDGVTIRLFIDSVQQPAAAQYDSPRSDIATLFPGYANTDGPIGLFSIDTTTLANGVHTIAWLVTDNLGRADGIGSRYFTVLN